MDEQCIGFVGAGQMARALAGAFVARNLIQGRQLMASDPSGEALNAFVNAVPEAQVFTENDHLLARTDIVFLATKPQHMGEVMGQVRQAGAVKGKLFVSIAAGVPLSTLCRGLGTQRVIRVMPNTPCIVGAGASAYCLASGATPEDGRWIGQLLEAVGVAFPLGEELLDAVTGLSGSGPAYVFQVIEAMSDGGVLAGLPRHIATQLAAQTVLGAAQMVLASHEHPAVLKDRVASPAGTTMAGLMQLEQGGLRAALISAVVAATERSRQLGQAWC